ncbi:MAG: PAS domain-containing sensor histidine kinase [Candidatus Thorarchaeota archaeon]|jgi:PAS domain S-box-containing protein
MSKKATPKSKSKGNQIKLILGSVNLGEAALRKIISDSHDAIIILNDKLEFQFINDEGYRIFGGTAEDLLGHFFGDFMTEKDVAFVAETFQKRVKGQKVPTSYPLSLIRKDGALLRGNVRVSLIESIEGSRKVLVHAQDQTEQMKNQEALKTSEERYRTLVETMNDGLAIDDDESILTYANEAFCNMLEYTPAEIIGRSWVDFTKDKDRDYVDTKIEERKAGLTERYEMQWRTKSGRIVPTVISAAPIFDSEENFAGTFAVITEITVQKEAEDTVQFYLDLLTHDIANQLQVIMTSAGLLDSELPKSYLDDAQTDIQDAVERCNRLITKVKRAGQLRYLPRTSMDLSTVVKEKVAVLERVYGAKISVKGLDKASLVWADALLGELVWNLLENAARHNPVEDKKVWISKKKMKNGFVILEISDNGPGISKSRKKTLFEYSKRHGGVGLTLVNQMARKYGGTLEIEDRVKGNPNQGAKFILSLKESK